MPADSEILEAIANIQQKLSDGVLFLNDIWADIGITGPIRSQRLELVKNHISSIVSDMTKEETNLRENLIKSIDRLVKELSKFTEELHIDKYKPPDDLAILFLERDLRKKRDELDIIRKQRLETYEKLKNEDVSLCALLSDTPYYLEANTIPSEKQLDELREHIKSSRTEYESRLEKFKQQKLHITNLFNELEQVSKDVFERDIISLPANEFCLSIDNIILTDALEARLEKQLSINSKEAKELGDKLDSLWNRLQIEMSEREQFLEKCSGSKPSTIAMLKNEIARLEILKKNNISKFIELTRVELDKWWTKCFYSQEQKYLFKPFSNDNFTEELLDKHEVELDIMRKYYTDNEAIFEKITNYQAMWAEYLELEQMAHDPNRFANRGGKILKVEKQKRKLEKDLPKIEKQISNEINSLNISPPILIFGLPFDEFVIQQREDYESEKIREKELRKENKDKETMMEMRYGSKPSGKRRLPANTVNTITSVKSPKKQKMEAATTGVVSSGSEGTLCAGIKTKNENETEPLHVDPFKKPNKFPATQNGNTPSRTKIEPVKSENVNPNIGCALEKMESADGDFTIGDIDYTEFSNRLATKPNCRSSVIPGHK